MADAATTWVAEVLGDHSIIRPLSVNDRKRRRGQQIRQVQDAKGTRWILKEVAVAQEWRAEVHAYQHWVPAIDGHAPALLAAEEALHLLLLSEVPGEHPSAARPAVNRRAGALLRRLHQAHPPQEQLPCDRDREAARVERLLVEARELLGPQEVAFVRAQADRLAVLSAGPKVPCHGDYRQHNWLLDATNTLRVIDFGKARWELAAWDMAKLFFRPWWRRPQLASAFFDGYGRPLTAEEAEFIQRRMAIDALSQAAFGAKRRSERHVQFGRSRLTELMAGHQVVTK